MSYRNPPTDDDPLIVAQGGAVYAVHRDSGKVVWSARVSAGTVVRLDITEARVFAVGPGADLYCLAYRSGDVLWRSRRADHGAETLFAEGRHVFVASRHLECFLAETGRSLWTIRPDESGLPALGMPYRIAQADHRP